MVIWAPLATSEAALAEVRAAVAAFAEAGMGVDPATGRSQPGLPAAEWRDAWKKYFHVTRVTPRIVIVPSWEQHVAAPGEVDAAIRALLADSRIAYINAHNAAAGCFAARIERDGQ